jgi:UDP-N-acetylglucosamine--N-acetylmuramyl-(pentapeptide) pyrophosphoryl-undecaprenol N-acetylglucosamine transferase
MLSKKATMIFTASEGMEKFFPAGKIMVSGNPVRSAIVEHKISREEAVRHFGLSNDKKTVLSIGGSLGAKNINMAIAKDIDMFEENDMQLIWQTGKPFKAEGLEHSRGRSNIHVNDFITQMEYAYAAADIVISRSGAMAISELSLIQKPVVFVPYPFAAEDHQTVNAQSLVNKDAAMMIRDNEALDKLVPAVLALSKDSQLQEKFKNNIGRLAVTDADRIIAEKILDSI